MIKKERIRGGGLINSRVFCSALIRFPIFRVQKKYEVSLILWCLLKADIG